MMAAIPMVIYAVKELGIRRRCVRVLIFAGAISMCFFGIPIINKVSGAKSGDSSVTMYYLDTINISSRSEIESMDIKSEVVKKSLITGVESKCSHFQNKRVNVTFWECSKKDGGVWIDSLIFPLAGTDDYKELKSVWMRSVAGHPMAYIGYKVDTYMYFLFDTLISDYDGGDRMGGEYNPRFRSLYSSASTWIGFWNKHFSFIYCGGVWLIIGIAILCKITKDNRIKNKEFFSSAIFSSIIYILFYVSAAVTSDYRFIYYPVIITTVIWIIICLETRGCLKR